MKTKSFAGIFLIGCLMLTGTHDAFARRRRYKRWQWDRPGRHHEVNHRGQRYLYHAGLFFMRAGLHFILSTPPVGVVVPALPLGHVTFRFGPRRIYYCYDGIYYRQIPEGYVVVPEDEFEELLEKQETSEKVIRDTEDMYTVNVPNSDGTYTEILLRKTEGGYIGPQGEYYEGNPSVEQLKILYGE